MESLQDILSTWLDPQVVGPLAIDWGLRLLGAVMVFVVSVDGLRRLWLRRWEERSAEPRSTRR